MLSQSAFSTAWQAAAATAFIRTVFCSFIMSMIGRLPTALPAAEYFDVPVVFAKKTKTKNIAGEVYTTKVESFTHGTVYDIIVSKEFLGKGDKVLVIDDFLAKGKALDGLTTLIQDSGAELVGAGIVIEKGFQDGGKRIRDKGIRVESLAIVDSMNAETGEIVFRNEDK